VAVLPVANLARRVLRLTPRSHRVRTHARFHTALVPIGNGAPRQPETGSDYETDCWALPEQFAGFWRPDATETLFRRANLPPKPLGGLLVRVAFRPYLSPMSIPRHERTFQK
jgi:hypothetical protein